MVNILLTKVACIIILTLWLCRMIRIVGGEMLHAVGRGGRGRIGGSQKEFETAQAPLYYKYHP